MPKIARDKSRKYKKSRTVKNIETNTTHNNTKSGVKFSKEEYMYQNITLQDGKILEDTYTHTNYNGKHSKKHTRRIIPVTKNSISVFQHPTSSNPVDKPLFSLFRSPHPYTNAPLPVLQLRNRMPTPFSMIPPHNRTQSKRNTKYSRKYKDIL